MLEVMGMGEWAVHCRQPPGASQWLGPECKPWMGLGVGLGKGASERNGFSAQNDSELAEGEGHPGRWAWGPSGLESPPEGKGWLSNKPWLPHSLKPVPKDQSGPAWRNGHPAHFTRACCYRCLSHRITLGPFTGTIVSQANWKCGVAGSRARGPGEGME